MAKIESWWAWRDHLDRVQDPNIATLKREADCEIARILRCCESRWEPERPRPRPAPGGGGGAGAGWGGGGGGPGAGADGRAGQPLGRASPDDEGGLEPRFSVPSAV